MTRFAAPFAVLCLCAAPVWAEAPAAPVPAPVPDTENDKGFSLMEEGAKLFFKGIMQEMEPAMDDLKNLADTMEPTMRQFVRDMGPALAEVLKKVDDLTMYHPPEMLPNGDIIMRRKQPVPPTPPADPGEVDL